MLQILVGDKPLNVNEDIEIAVEEINSLWVDEISYTLPVNVCYTSYNLLLLGLKRPFRSNIVNMSLPCRITHENFDKKGLIKTCEINEDDGEIELGILLDEAEWFEWAKSTKLKDLNFPEPITLQYQATSDSGTYYFFNFVKNAWPEFKLDPLPQITNFQRKTLSTISSQAKIDELIEEYDSYIVQADFTNCMFATNYSSHTNFNWMFATQGDITAYFPMTPLLFARTILRYIFEGWIVKDNPFMHGDLARLFVFNKNLIAPLNGEKFDYHKLVPSVTVAEFVKSLEAICGCRLYIDPIHRIARWISLDGVLTGESKPIYGIQNMVVKPTKKNKFTITAEAVETDYTKKDDKCIEDLLSNPNVHHYQNVEWDLDNNVYNTSDEDYPWTNPSNPQERIIFDEATQIFGIEKWEPKDDEWAFTRSVIGCSLMDKSIGDIGEDGEEIKIELKGIVRNDVARPVYPVSWNYNNEHNFETEFFKESTSTPLGFSIQRGYILNTSLNSGSKSINNTVNHSFILGNCELGAVPYYISIGDRYPNIYFMGYQFANSDVYDSCGRLLRRDALTAPNRIEDLSKQYYSPTKQLIALTPCGEYGIYENFYKNVAKFYITEIPVEITTTHPVLSKEDITHKIKIDNTEFVIMKRKRTLTLHHNIMNSVELRAVII